MVVQRAAIAFLPRPTPGQSSELPHAPNAVYGTLPALDAGPSARAARARPCGFESTRLTCSWLCSTAFASG